MISASAAGGPSGKVARFFPAGRASEKLMRVEVANNIDSSSLERLTNAIRSGFANIEKHHRGALDYGKISLRGAMERGIYQQALFEPAALLALARASRDRNAFAEWLPASNFNNTVSDLISYARAWARLVSRGLLRVPGVHGKRKQATRTDFVFHALRPRFIDFFWPIIEHVGADRCALLCEPGYGVEQAAKQHGLAVCERVPAHLHLRSLRRPPGAIFPHYVNAVVGLLDAFGTLRCYHPRAVVFAEAASSLEEIVARAARALGIATIRVQHGRAGLLSPGYHEMPYDKMLMWGEGFARRLREISPDCQYIVTGSPLMDRFAQAAWRSERPLFPNDKHVVTVISQPECVNISRQDYRSLVSIIERVLVATDAVNVLVRLHPADNAVDFNQLAGKWPDRVRVTTPEDIALEAVIGGSVLVIGLYSTVLSEAAAAGVLPVVIRLGERHRVFPSPEDEGAAVLATTADEAVERIVMLVANPAARTAYQTGMRAFAKKYFGPMDGGATDRIAAQLENAGQVSA